MLSQSLFRQLRDAQSAQTVKLDKGLSNLAIASLTQVPTIQTLTKYIGTAFMDGVNKTGVIGPRPELLVSTGVNPYILPL